MKRLMFVMSITAASMLYVRPVSALDYATATGADIVKENASKESGYSSAQLETLQEKLQGKELTFENGKVTNVSKDDDCVKVSVDFKDASGATFSPSFSVSAKVTDASAMKVAEQFDKGLKVKLLKGKVARKGAFMISFELTDVQIVPEKMPSDKPPYDPATVTGADIVRLNASKESGFTSAQLDTLQEVLQGKIMTFENGKVMSISKDDDYVNVNVDFKDPNAKGMFTSTFTVSAKVTDPSAMKIAERFDKELKIKSIKGKVARKGAIMMFFELTDAQIVPAETSSNKPLFDPATVKGADIVKGNAAKESGYSSAQLERLQDELQGKELTFENGKVTNVSKDDDCVKVSIDFKDASAAMFSPSFTVSAKVTDAAAMKVAEQFDKGLKVKSLKGKVARKGAFMISFELTDVQIVPEKMPSDNPPYDPATVTGADIVRLNASKESGFTSAQLDTLQEALQGKIMTFENGKVMSISKDDDYINVNVDFKDPNAKGMFTSTFTVSAKVTDPSAMKIAERFDKELKIKSIKGKVARKGAIMMFFELTDAQIVPAK